MELFYYSGAGNDFVVADGREQDCSRLQEADTISRLCEKYGTDGLMILENSDTTDFRMLYFNSDGSGGMMCGNGGRCIVAFAVDLGVVEGGHCRFEAPDGEHEADIQSDDGALKVVRLKMIDVESVTNYPDGCFLNTGTRHFVRLVEDVDGTDVDTLGKEIRWRSEFAPQGTNVNFVTPSDGALKVRTFEKGVEGETLACGTGIVASAVAAWAAAVPPTSSEGTRVRYAIHARRDDLAVDFVPASGDKVATSVFLTGPAERIKQFNENV